MTDRDLLEALRRRGVAVGSEDRRPYNLDTEREVLARLRKGAPGAGPSAPLGPVDTRSPFFDRLIEDYFRLGAIPVEFKDVGSSRFGTPTKEDTRTWGDSTTALSFKAPGLEPTLTTNAGNGSALALKVNRERPTTFTLLTTVVFGQGWNLDGQAIITITYTVGIGLVKVPIVKQFIIPSTAFAIGTQVVLDITTAPLQSLVASVSLNASNNNVNQQHDVLVSMLAAPVVQ